MFSNLMLTAQADTTGYLIGQFGVIVVMIAILYFFMIRPQRKRDKEVTEMRGTRSSPAAGSSAVSLI